MLFEKMKWKIIIYKISHFFKKECTGSICMAYGLESCQCKQGPNDSPAKLCELCCRMPSDDSTCKYVMFILFSIMISLKKFFFSSI